jgi:hypothetical protein
LAYQSTHGGQAAYRQASTVAKLLRLKHRGVSHAVFVSLLHCDMQALRQHLVASHGRLLYEFIPPSYLLSPGVKQAPQQQEEHSQLPLQQQQQRLQGQQELASPHRQQQTALVIVRVPCR